MKPDGRKDFQDFLDETPICSKLTGNAMAKAAFEELCKIPNIYKMIVMSEKGEPALAACISDVEKLLGQQDEFDLNVDFNKQALGRMVKTILEPFGYSWTGQEKPIRRELSDFITSAAVYSLDF